MSLIGAQKSVKEYLLEGRIVVLGLGVHNKLSVCEEKGVAACFPGRRDHFFVQFRAQLGHVVNYLPRVAAARNTEAEVELHLLQKRVLKVVFLNHYEPLHFRFPNCKFEFCAYCLQLQEVGPELVLDRALLVILFVDLLLLLLSCRAVVLDVDENDAALDVADLVAHESDVDCVGREQAEESLGWLGERLNEFRRYVLGL